MRRLCLALIFLAALVVAGQSASTAEAGWGHCHGWGCGGYTAYYAAPYTAYYAPAPVVSYYAPAYTTYYGGYTPYYRPYYYGGYGAYYGGFIRPRVGFGWYW